VTAYSASVARSTNDHTVTLPDCFVLPMIGSRGR
jgi:hypothetical protein